MTGLVAVVVVLRSGAAGTFDTRFDDIGWLGRALMLVCALGVTTGMLRCFV